MKICIINNLYPPYARGGAEQVVVKTVEGLREAGHEVVLVAGSPKDEEGDKTIRRYKPFNLFFYTDAHKHSFLVRFLWHLIDMFHFGSARYVRRILQQEKPDVVHTHNLMGLGFLIPRVIRKLGIHHVHTVHDVQLVEPSGIILKTKEKSFRYNGFPTKFYSWIMKKLMGSPEVVISPSQFLLDFYGERGFFQKSKFVVVRNPMTFGVESLPARLGSAKRAGKAGRKLKVESEDNSFNFLYLGQIEGHKGIEFLVESFLKFLSKNSVQTKLHIVGDGSFLNKIRTLSENEKRIVVHGRVDRSELPVLFASTDMTIVPSLCYENSPTVIFESFSFGVPVLASDIEGIAELIREGENGLTFAAGDEGSLLEKLTWCLENKERLKEMSQKTSISSRSERDYVERLEELYREA